MVMNMFSGNYSVRIPMTRSPAEPSYLVAIGSGRARTKYQGTRIPGEPSYLESDEGPLICLFISEFREREREVLNFKMGMGKRD
ncbi:hypothetical protein QVD17_15748 [Tagetes erecta]|uniref:Uncharacterized protein n=1 Tax=Tagetes erecta TaxID=13708 RepID=A0AAD8NSX6_TARER|nr:hypothetical protein QVD17_15748 [Tagetes erecta]